MISAKWVGLRSGTGCSHGCKIWVRTDPSKQGGFPARIASTDAFHATRLRAIEVVAEFRAADDSGQVYKGKRRLPRGGQVHHVYFVEHVPARCLGVEREGLEVAIRVSLKQEVVRVA
eukprot:CAMPEP_0195122940 /NCGR_PEP_ID=MMETSP0448-20130528/127577_1 /TAXON_ID=66468 /ORGANISM="Heterocapsa triquestra, Strain CCMP 448" /LENGTH=116 /DNA_ID=CAMNT_0040160463 /DNA_START=302 /DNA_END=647 /DNA_ORIENTATION=-